MKKGKDLIAILLLVTFLTSACARYLQPVATLEELDSKENIEKRKNWFANSHARTSGAAGMGAAMVFIPILIPVAMATVFTADEKDLTVKEIADVTAIKTYDYDSTLFLEWIAYMDGAGAPDYWIIGRGKGNKEANGIKPVGVIYWNKNKNTVYYEGWLIRKMEDGNYQHWRAPLLKKEGDNLVYAFDKTLKLKEAKMVGAYNLINFNFSKKAGGGEISKEEDDVFKDMRSYYLSNNPEMEKIRCAKGSEECAPKEISKDIARLMTRETAPAKDIKKMD